MKRPSAPYCLSDDDAGPDQHRSNLFSNAAFPLWIRIWPGKTTLEGRHLTQL